MEGGIIPVNEHSRNLCLVWHRNDVRSDSRGINASFLFRYFIIYIFLFFFFFSVIVVKKTTILIIIVIMITTTTTWQQVKNKTNNRTKHNNNRKPNGLTALKSVRRNYMIL